MNRKQRDQNRENARRLADNAVVCTNCGGRGRHYVVDPIPSLGGDGSGWICEKRTSGDERG